MLSRRVLRRRFATAPSSLPYAGNQTLGIVREAYGMWERRAPLGPEHVRELTKQGVKVLVQPCKRRIFIDEEYKNAGAIIKEDISDASLIIGVKKIQPENILPNKNYMFFSHVIKAQPANMSLLDTILQRNARLFDYECITKDGRDDTPRLVAFGQYAGMAGMIDGFQGLGVRLIADGNNSPFLNVPFSFMHEDLQAAKENLKNVASQINKCNFTEPLIFAFTGAGNVGKGARHIFELLPHEYVTLDELPNLRNDIKNGKRPANKLYAVNVFAEQMVSPLVPTNQPFDKQHYYAHPELYRGTFHEKVLPYISVLVNGMYWDYRFPRLVTKEHIKELRKQNNFNLKLVADISCDIGGSCEFLTKSTNIEQPFFTYIPETDESLDAVTNKGILMLGVDILPSELPRDASQHFAKALMPLIPPLLSSKGSAHQLDHDDLPAELRRACITSHGKLLPKWQYIQRLREQNSSALLAKTGDTTKNSKSVITNIEMRGHLFDSGLINKVLDLMDNNPDVFCKVTNLDVRPNTTSGSVPSRLLLSLSGDNEKVSQVINKIKLLIDATPKAEGVMNTTTKNEILSVTTQRRVLLFGSGRVAKPVIKLFNQHKDVHITIATDDQTQANELISCIDGDGRGAFVSYKFPQDNEKLSNLVSNSDIVISLLPATMHMPVAKECVKQRRHLVTASYVSKEMQALHEEAKAKGVILMNEAGLDPGIDHMLIMEAIDSIHERGGKVTELVSLCGGLPDPVAADNPLRYKISWSPRGFLMATKNSATYLKNNQLININSDDLLLSATPSHRFPTMRLEVIPNRDSLAYKNLYGVPSVHSICRGTLRYEGWANVFQAMKVLNLLELDVLPSSVSTWRDLLINRCEHTFKKYNIKYDFANNGGESLRNILKKALILSNSVQDIPAALYALEWLGVLEESNSPSLQPGTASIDALGNLLEKKLKFEDTEKDMVAMFHTIVGQMPDGTIENHTSKLLAFGTPGDDTAMSATVGYTTAAAAELVLFGKLDATRSGGVMIPITKDIYEPMLKRLNDFGITWNSNITKTAKPAVTK